jgi:PAS domain S-box-containing protein
LAGGVLGHHFARWEQSVKSHIEAVGRSVSQNGTAAAGWQNAYASGKIFGGIPRGRQAGFHEREILSRAAMSDSPREVDPRQSPLPERTSDISGIGQPSSDARLRISVPPGGFGSEPAEVSLSLRRFIELDRKQGAVVFEISDGGDQLGTILMTNTRLTELLGYTEGEAVGRSILNFFDPGSSRSPVAILRRLCRARSPREDQEGQFELKDIRLVRKDGTMVWCDTRGHVIGDSEGRLLGIAYLEDVTASREAAELLAASEASTMRLLEIILHTADAITMIDLAERVIFYNPAAHTLMGYPPDAALSRNLSDFHPDWALQKLRKEAFPFVAQQGAWLGETALRHRDGYEIPVSQMILALKSDTGDVQYLASIVRDMRDIKRAYEVDVARARLNQTKLLARTLAHHGNTLSMALSTSIEALRGILEPSPAGSSANPEVSRHIQIQKRVMGRITAMFRRLRELIAEPAFGPPFDLHSLLQRSELQAFLDQDVHLEVELDSMPFEIRVPKDLIEDIIESLLTNAKEAMRGRDEKRVTVKTSQVRLTTDELNRLAPTSDGALTSGEYLRLIIADTGCGIAEPQSIFEPYFTTKSLDGVMERGLGLARVRKFVEDAGGFIVVDSTIDVGSQFAMYFPKVEGIPTLQDPSLLGKIHATPGLFVDDEENMRVTFPIALSGRGFQPLLTASDVEEAIDVLEKHPEIGFVITDLKTPKGSGTQVLAWVRRNRGPRMPVIFFTGEAASSWAAIKDPFSALVEKPAQVEVLGGIVEALMERALASDSES